MNALFNRYATPLTVGLFAVSAISGVALFFHWGQAAFHEMHEWLSMVLLLPVAWHIWRNWQPIVAYARRGSLLIPLLISAIASLAFAWPALTDPHPAADPRKFMIQASLTDLAPVFKTTPEILAATLRQRGHVVASTQDSIVAIARASKAPPSKILRDAIPPANLAAGAPAANEAKPR